MCLVSLSLIKSIDGYTANSSADIMDADGCTQVVRERSRDHTAHSTASAVSEPSQ